ncbi:MAG: response regulator [Campylobacterota bacterium]|nr:response regulator [Campylobacterota bacterium]
MKNKRVTTIYEQTDCGDAKYNILVVDDSKTFNQKITDGLNIQGHNLTQCYLLNDARKLIENNNYDFILLDLILPDGEGDELIDELSEELRAKIIVLSGDTDMQRRGHIFDTGILEYFSKTNPTHMLLEDIKNLLCNVEKNSFINILLVDDSSFMRRMLKGILSPKRFNIYEAKDGINGLEVLNKEDIHLMLLDYEMPGMDGIELLETIKRDIRFLELPVIMLSGNDSKDIVARALKHGASDFLKKPFATEELLLKCDLQVKDYINKKRIQIKEKELAIALEKTKKSEEYKSLFLANMSHEIRTPLNGIVGFVNILAEEEKDKKKLDYLNTIQKSSDLLLNLINDILDFSKIESNKLDINKEVFIVDELYHLLRSVYNPMAIEKDIELNSYIDTNVPKYFYSDFLRIKQIMTNLISNAIKFTPKKGKITISLELTEDKKSIQFSVSDTGIGIAKENHTKVFELFSQAESTTTKKFGGTGLGLSISAKLVKLLGGTIGINSEINQGSCFYFNLPIVKIDEEKIEHRKTKESSKIKDITSTFSNHILLVEDNKTNQQFMSIILKKLGLTLEIANDGYEALEKFKEKEYDLILMDENMPNMSGIEATKLIRGLQREHNLKYTPIVALTANAIKGDRERFIEAGMDEYLSKPLDKVKLVEVLTSLLNSDKVFDLINKRSEKTDNFPEKFTKNTIKAVDMLEMAVADEDFASVIKLINLIKISAMRYKLQDIFALCLEIEQSANDKDAKSCENFIMILKGLLNNE